MKIKSDKHLNVNHQIPKSTILAQIPLSPGSKGVKSCTGNNGTDTAPPQRMNPTRFLCRLKNLMARKEFSEIFYDKTVLDIHHIIIVNWKIFEHEIMRKHCLWGRSRCFSTFNREIIVQGYQKVKFQSLGHKQKVLIYLRSVELETDSLRSHIPCFIPAAEIRKKQAALSVDPRFKSILESRKKKHLTRVRDNPSPIKCSCNTNSSTINELGDEHEQAHQSHKTAHVTNRENTNEYRSTISPFSATKSKSLYQVRSRKRKRSENEPYSPDMKSPHSTVQNIDKLKSCAIHNLIESLINEHISSLWEIILGDEIIDDQDREDVLIWDPSKVPEKQVVKYLREWKAIRNQGRLQEEDQLVQTMNTRQPDIETALLQLSASNYNVEKALKTQKLGKYTIFVDDIDNTNSFSQGLHQITDKNELDIVSESLLSEAGYLRNLELKQKIGAGMVSTSWTNQMKFNFEKGLILFGENVDKIRGHFQCFEHLKPIHLDLYFYSDQRQKFISCPENAKKVVNIIDQTPFSHLQKIEFFELGKDWAKMRQHVVTSSSESSEDSYFTELKRVNKFGRTVRTMQPKRKKRPKRLPDRFINFQM